MAIVKVEKNRYTVDTLYQWDKDQVLEIYGLSLASIPEIHFTNAAMDGALVRQATMNDAGVISVEVPNSVLQKPYKITVYVCTYENEAFKTLYSMVIPVEARSKPTDYTIEVTDEEVYSFNALENKIDNVLAVSLVRYDEVNTKYEQTEARYVQACETLDQAIDNYTQSEENYNAGIQEVNAAKEFISTGVENVAKSAEEASESATSAQASAENASTSEANAAASKVASAQSADSAKTSANNASAKAEEAKKALEDIVAELAERNQLVPLFANSIDECTDTTKLYVLPDGYIYAYLYIESNKPEITITREDGGCYVFYNNKYNWSSDSSFWCWYTNYIPVTPGDILKYKSGWSDKYCPDVGWFDASYNCISTEYRELRETDYTAPEGAVYAQFHAKGQNEDSHFLEVEWVYCQAAVATYQWASTGHAFVPADYESEILDHEKRIIALEKDDKTKGTSILKGKKIVYDGDSICSSWGISTNGGAYPQIIADIVGGTFDNQGVGGGRIVTQEGSADTFHSIVDNLVNLPTDGDLYCFEGGVNDHWHDVPLGTYSKSDYTGALDKTTYCGALETIFRYATTNFVGKPICYIITHKCPFSAFSKYGTEHTFADFRDAALGICEKYSIPVYDAWKDSGINSWNASQLANYFIVDEDTGTGDGTHPNEAGYKRYYVPQLIALFEKIMPVE